MRRLTGTKVFSALQFALMCYSTLALVKLTSLVAEWAVQILIIRGASKGLEETVHTLRFKIVLTS